MKQKLGKFIEEFIKSQIKRLWILFNEEDIIIIIISNVCMNEVKIIWVY